MSGDHWRSSACGTEEGGDRTDIQRQEKIACIIITATSKEGDDRYSNQRRNREPEEELTVVVNCFGVYTHF